MAGNSRDREEVDMVDGQSEANRGTTVANEATQHEHQEKAAQNASPESNEDAQHVYVDGDKHKNAQSPSLHDEISLNLSKDIPDNSTSSSAIDEKNVESTITPPAEAASEQDPEASRTKAQTIIIMASLCASVFLAALDTTIITTALPTISSYFNSNAGYTWIGSAYLLANAAAVPSWGKVSDIWGRKPVLLAAAGIFFFGSLLCATSVSIGMLIAARAVQGIGGGGLIILVNICISDLFSMRNRATYFGIIGMVWALASAVGPLLGGVFTQKVSWRWCFYINLPITGITSVLLFYFLHLDSPKTPIWEGLKAIDWAGSLLIVGGTLMVLLGLEFGGVIHPWGSPIVVCLVVFGALVFALFILNEWKFARYPVMPLRLFNHRSNVASLAVCFCHGYVFIAGTYYMPLYFQAVLGASPLQSGIYALPFAVTLSLVSGGTGIFIKKTGKYLPPIWAGLLIMCLGYGLFIDLPLDAHWAKIILYQIVAGMGVGPNFQAPLIAFQTMIKRADIASATSTFGFTRNLATSISVVIGSVVFSNQMEKRQPSLILALGPQTADLLSGGSAGASVSIVAQLPADHRAAARLAYWESLRAMWIMYVAFAALGLLCSAFIGEQVLSKEHEITKTGLKAEEANRLEEVERRRNEKVPKDVVDV